MADSSAHAWPRSWRAISAVAIGITAATLVAGCTGSSGDGSASPTASSTATSPTSAAPTSAGPTSAGASGASASASTTDPARTTARGNIDQTIAPVVVPTRSAVALDRTAVADSSVRVTLRSVRSVKVTAQGPGEVAGAALALTVGLVNTSSRSIDLGSAVVRVLDSAGQVATPTTASPNRPLTGVLGAGATAQGVYVVTVAANRRSPIDVYVSYKAGTPVVHFRGEAA